MPRWFVSTRAQSVGGPVAPVKILDADRPGYPYDLTAELVAAVRGREAYFGAHGFEVNEADGIAHLTYWFGNLQIGNALPVGILWPGDCVIPIGIDYVFEGLEAIQSGDLIADFLNANFTGAASLSFGAHSLGARVVLQAIDGLSRRVRRALFMAGAIDNDCLIGEYNFAAGKIDQISILASTEDDVLALAFPLGNPLQGIIDCGHPYYRAALGGEGPAQPYPPAPGLQPNWQIPANFDYGHHDYLPSEQLMAAFPLPVDIPVEQGQVPPVGTPAQLADPAQWKPAWSAAFAATRYK
ncbi:MAG: hypothetical protein ABR921_12515 [Candidatus Sulfotelmatobacter sp.]|jgi:hypothetical protein